MPTDVYQVSGGQWDAMETADGATYDGTGPLITPISSTLAALRRHVGVGFGPVEIERGSDIMAASVELHVTTRDDANLDIYGEDVDDAADFVATPDVIDRTRTTASTAWVAVDMGLSQWHASPDIADPVAEVIARPGWTSPGRVMLLLWGRSDSTQQVYARSYEYDTSLAAKLTVTHVGPSRTLPWAPASPTGQFAHPPLELIGT